MMFYFGNWQSKQVYEGIDKISLLFRVPWNQYLDPLLFRHKYITLKKKTTQYNTYYYLIIQGEFINHDKDIADSITDAMLLLIKSGALTIPKIMNILRIGKEESFSHDDIPRIIIYSHLDLFFSGISEIEFFHDFPKESFNISPEARIIETNTEQYTDLVSTDLSFRSRCLIKNMNTYYTYDYRGNKRHSVIDFYDRTKKLLDENNQYPKSLLEKNKIIRLEFRCVRSNLYRYLTIYNLYGRYENVIKRFSGVLARSYKKYISDLLIIDSTRHPHFNEIYSISKEVKIKYLNFGLFRNTKRIPDCYKCDYIFSRIVMYYYAKKYNLPDDQFKYPDYDLFHPTYFIDENDFNYDHQYRFNHNMNMRYIEDKHLYTEMSPSNVAILTLCID